MIKLVKQGNLIWGLAIAAGVAGLGTGVSVADVITDTHAPDMRYMPNHPDANAQGYVAFPHMNPAEDMVDLLNTSRSYQANIAAMSAVKDMINHSLDIMK